MTNTNRIVLTDKVELLDSFVLYKKVKGNIPGIKSDDIVELSIDLTFENKRALYRVDTVEYSGVGNNFTAQLLFVELID